MCSAAPAAGGPHLLPEQEEEAALQQEGQEGSVSRQEGTKGRGEKGRQKGLMLSVIASCVPVKLHCGAFCKDVVVEKEGKQTLLKGSIKKTIMIKQVKHDPVRYVLGCFFNKIDKFNTRRKNVTHKLKAPMIIK